MSKVELLAPVGDWDCLKAAVQNGADAVYFGVEQFNARMYAKNFNIDFIATGLVFTFFSFFFLLSIGILVESIWFIFTTPHYIQIITYQFLNVN